MKDELWLVIVPAKLVFYWLAIFVVFHAVRWKKAAEPPPLRWSFISALIRFAAGILMALPLGLILANRSEGLILLVFFGARFAAWMIALIPYYRRYPGVPVIFAIVMTGLNFVVDLFIFDKWLPEFLGRFRMC